MTQFEMDYIAKQRIAHLIQEAEKTREIRRYTACKYQTKKRNRIMQKLWQLLTLGLVVVLAACSTTQPATPSEETNDALFSDADFENATLDLAKWEQLEPREETPEDLEPINLQMSSLITVNAVGIPSEQTGISGARGLQYFIERNFSTQPSRIIQTEQWKGVDARKTIYQGNCEI